MPGMDVSRAYRFRCYPTSEQAALLARTFGCVRYVYNHMLRLRSDAWEQRQERVGYHQTSAALTALKKTPGLQWLGEVSSVPLQQSLRHLHTAFTNFFARRAKYPSFKSRHERQAAEYTASAFRWDGKALMLAKMDEALPIRFSRTVPAAARVTTVTVSRDAAGRYFVSMLCDDTVQPLPLARAQVGIDLGLTHFATLSSGEKIPAPNTLRRHAARLARLQRRLAKKQKGSSNRAKARRKVARAHAAIADARRDFLHKLSTRLIHENQVVAVETLAVRNMLRNRHLAKSIADAGWGEFLRQLQYKARWYGRTLVTVDRWFPSSKRCSDCGHIAAVMPLAVRAWTCASCGSDHDRDLNAARNVLAAGLAASAHGEAVSPAGIAMPVGSVQ
jgi:putative transposase